ncbi:DUF2939 domain-containing protein [Microbulbifer sp. Q7]|uniref:DUF2939 domain-containing protein n=1 Tax=Microbulbifer sp. Q7 TaxID=1785091 RepID=UPI00083331FB|nr:DUF2939 domain-containing protein [Microbulbifer sp. Q7]
MGKWLLRTGLAVVLVGGVYAALPWYSAHRLIEAAHHEDTAALERYVDFPVLRANIRARIQAKLQQSMGEDIPPDLGGLFAAGADLLLGPLVDRLISAQGIADLIQGQKDWRAFERDLERVFGGTGRQPQTPPPQRREEVVEDTTAAEHDHHWQLRRWYFSGPNTVSVICGNKVDETGVKLSLQRNGWRWQLVDMVLIDTENGEI